MALVGIAAFFHARPWAVSMAWIAGIWICVPPLLRMIHGIPVPHLLRGILIPLLAALPACFMVSRTTAMVTTCVGFGLWWGARYRTEFRQYGPLLSASGFVLAMGLVAEHISQWFPGAGTAYKIIGLWTILWALATVLSHRLRLCIRLLQDARWMRVTFYFLNYMAGWSVVHASSGTISADAVLEHIVVFAALALTAWHAIVTNNIADYRIDAISNPDRPLVAGIIDRRSYLISGWVALVLGILLAGTVSAYTACFMLLCATGYWVYSAPPLRLKRLPVFGKLIIGFNVWCMWLMAMVPDGSTLVTIPSYVHVYAFIGVGITSNFIDLKDIEGDRANGILTLPVLLGKNITLALVIAATFISYAVLIPEVQGKVWKFLAWGNMGLQVVGYFPAKYRDYIPFLAMNLGMAGFIISQYLML